MSKINLAIGCLGMAGWLVFRIELSPLLGARIFMVGLSLFYLNQHLRISLVQLEVLGLLSLSIVSYKSITGCTDLLLLFSLIVVAVIEAALGLRLVVKQVRNLNSEFLKFNFYLEYSIQDIKFLP